MNAVHATVPGFLRRKAYQSPPFKQKAPVLLTASQGKPCPSLGVTGAIFAQTGEEGTILKDVRAQAPGRGCEARFGGDHLGRPAPSDSCQGCATECGFEGG